MTVLVVQVTAAPVSPIVGGVAEAQRLSLSRLAQKADEEALAACRQNIVNVSNVH